ncbi:hydroxymethylbilane synthase [Maribacter algicola]|uniref:Hydroxymethylbilane synthase n=1 Tax=Meishania litoralis TaxID=3434685 RepID=A0ACC7LHH2_9FLAO
MNKVIRIGTRDSELALWQANTVKSKLEALGHQAELVPVKSTGDLVLDRPLYELGITGIFTKTLDIALLEGTIDIAVHSLKDVPTLLPKGIVQAAVLERGNYYDILAYKHNQEFLAQREATIATGSLRRKAQWLNRYPSHTVVDLRGNVNSRIEKLAENDWNGAIFAAAGLQRIGIEPENTIGLTWMIPAPGQGAVMVVALEKDKETLEACVALNHKETEICTSVERRFLNILEGGCTAPIGALATIEGEEMTLNGVLLSKDGKKKLEVVKTMPLAKSDDLAQICAESILSRGGRRLMKDLQAPNVAPSVFSTKKLTADQLQLFNAHTRVASEDFIKTSPSRIAPALLKSPIENVIITSQNAVESLLKSSAANSLKFKNIYCVGRRTKRLIESRIGPVKYVASNAQKLAEYLVEFMEGLEATYFCGNRRLDELPDIFEKNSITLNEVEAYSTKLVPTKVPEEVKAVLFFSPTGVESYLIDNKRDVTAYCIGETTAQAARKYFTMVQVAKIPTVESVIDLVNMDYGE